MIYGAEMFAVGSVKSIGILDFLPADKFTYSTFLSAVTTKFDIQQTGTL